MQKLQKLRRDRSTANGRCGSQGETVRSGFEAHENDCELGNFCLELRDSLVSEGDITVLLWGCKRKRIRRGKKKGSVRV